MRTRLLAFVGLALAVPAATLVPLVSAAGPAATASAGTPSSARPTDPRNVTNISDYMVACLQANAKYLSRDFAGAIDGYRKAIQLDTKQALGYYLLGEAQLANANLTEADASWKQAALVVGEPGLQGRILFVQADLKERQKNFQDARVAWQAYNQWAAQYAPGSGASSGDGGPVATTASDAGAPSYGAFPGSGARRVQDIDAMMKQDQAYDKVRKNIAIASDGGLFTLVEAGP